MIHVAPFPQESLTRSAGFLDPIHTDVCGTFKVTSLGGCKYYESFIDDFSMRIFIYTIKNKSEVLNKFKIFKLQVGKQTGRRIKALRSDNSHRHNKTALRNELIEPWYRWRDQYWCTADWQQISGKAYRLFDSKNQNIVERRDILFDKVISSKPNMFLGAKTTNVKISFEWKRFTF